MLRDKIIEDLKGIERYIGYIDRHQDKNFLVLEGNYINPKCNMTRIMSMNNVFGLYVYLEGIKETLLKALEKGRISRGGLPINSPEYLKELAI